MKINQECISPNNGKTTQDKADKHSFEQLLFSPAKQQAEGQFYRQHQHTLQPSCLTFHALQKHSKPDAFTLQSNEFIKESNSAITEEKPQMPVMQAQGTSVKTGELAHEMPANKLPDRQSDLPVHHFGVYEAPAKNLPLKQNIVEKTPLLRTAKPPAVYKNHHVFIDADQAELAINAAQLAPQELKKLIPAIKQALRDKKIHLQQLIINGERQ